MLRTPSPARTIPILETPRLRLRAHTPDDFPTYCTLWGDARVTEFIGGRPNTPEESWSRLLRNAGHWSLLGFGSWYIEEKATGDFVGESGLFDYRRTIAPPLGDTPEIGWILMPEKHGQGYATEAVQAILEWGTDRFISDEVACIVHPENTASLRVATRSGFIESHTIEYRDSPAVVLLRKLR